MKKISIVGLCSVLALMLCCCGNEAEMSTTEESHETVIIEETSSEQTSTDDEENSDEKEVSNLYETEELENVILGDVDFSIPGIWKGNMKNDDSWTYYYYNDLMFATNIYEENEMTNKELIANSDSYANGMITEENRGEIISNKTIDISGEKAIEISITQMIDGKEYCMDVISFIYNSNCYSLGWVVEKDSNIDYSDDYEAFKSSIVIKYIQEETEDNEEENKIQSEITMGEKNALAKAGDYLDFTAFSYNGLVEQLEYEKFSHEEAVFAADNCGANWNEQALAKAEDYLDYTAFSYKGLVEQLEYEGFTSEQATYGVENCGADWNEQAAKKAEDYLEFSSFSRDGLIDQLEYEGFTHEQATYGVEAVGF